MHPTTDTPTIDLDTPPVTDNPSAPNDTTSGGDTAPPVNDSDSGTDSATEANAGVEVVVPKADAVYLDPALLEIADNVRQNFRLEDHTEYTDSIREHGVLTPVKAIRMPDGRIVVRDGQVRTLTALAFEQPLVPVWVTDLDDSVNAKEAEIARITEQITVNDRRIALTDGDRAAGIAQMLDLGASVIRVARALQTKREQVKLAGKVGASRTARELIDNGQLDFERAAIIAEYETVGDTDAVQRLIDCPRGYFTYEAKRIAADRDEQRGHLAAALPYAEAGFGVLSVYPDIDGPAPLFVAASGLVDAEGEAVTTEHIHTDPGRWLVWVELADRPVYVELDTGALVDPDTVDWGTAHDPERTPLEGKRHAREVEQRDQWLVEYFLPIDQLATVNLFQPTQPDTDTDTGAPDDAQGDAGDEGDGEGESAEEVTARRRAAADARAAEEREQARQTVRRVRELNKQGLAAMQARREFVIRLLTRKTPPPQAAKLIAEALASDSGLLAEYNAFDTALELLGITGAVRVRQDLLQTIETATPARCQVIVLALVLGAYEKRTGKDCWRYTDRGIRHYLEFLRELGHQLVPVELAATGELDPEQIDIDTATGEAAQAA